MMKRIFALGNRIIWFGYKNAVATYRHA